MSVEKERLSPILLKLTVRASPEEITRTKNEVLETMSKRLKIPGFRHGKAPLSLVERYANASDLQSDFLEAAINRLYRDAVEHEKLRPIQPPKIAIHKFVPFTDLEFVAEVDVVGDVILPDYRRIQLATKAVTVSKKEVDDVVRNLQIQAATKADVNRPSKLSDQVIISFSGSDAKTSQPIKGADGKDYPLILGSKSFIPGFETNLVGMKPGSHTTFILTFPKDYGVASLQGRKVQFDVDILKVQKVTEPTLDDSFASEAGPFKTMLDLRKDIKKQLEIEKQSQARRDYQGELLDKIASQTEVAIPPQLVDEEVDLTERQIRQDLAYRGTTWQEYLEKRGLSEDAYRDSLREPAAKRVKAGLVLTEIADKENITVSDEELTQQLQLLKLQYKDQAMHAEIDKSENKQSILSRMLSDKTLARLTDYATAKNAA